MNKTISEIFKKFSNKFPQYYKIKNPGFILMTKYYIKKPTFKYLWFLFYKNPFRIIINFLLSVLPIIFFELAKKLFIEKIFKRKYKINLYSDISKNKVIDYFSRGEGFITISYCQKPMNCPDGRFSTKCSAKYFECHSCFLSEIKKKSDQLSLDYYIVLGDYDSVWNILKNQFLRKKRGAYILTVCTMVLNVIKYLSPLFGFRGLIIPFVKGECKTLAAYELSEFGYKNIQTDISESNKKIILEILEKAYQKKQEKLNKNQKLRGVVYEKPILNK